MIETCPCCGHPLPIEGVKKHLTPMQLRLFEMVEAAGAAGITRRALMERTYCNRPDGAENPNVLNVRKFQMARFLRRYGLAIVSDRRGGQGAIWRLQAISPPVPPPLPIGTRAFPARG